MSTTRQRDLLLSPLPTHLHAPWTRPETAPRRASAVRSSSVPLGRPSRRMTAPRMLLSRISSPLTYVYLHLHLATIADNSFSLPLCLFVSPRYPASPHLDAVARLCRWIAVECCLADDVVFSLRSRPSRKKSPPYGGASPTLPSCSSS